MVFFQLIDFVIVGKEQRLYREQEKKNYCLIEWGQDLKIHQRMRRARPMPFKTWRRIESFRLSDESFMERKRWRRSCLRVRNWPRSPTSSGERTKTGEECRTRHLRVQDRRSRNPVSEDRCLRGKMFSGRVWVQQMRRRSQRMKLPEKLWVLGL